jgi:hypothetical protein
MHHFNCAETRGGPTVDFWYCDSKYCCLIIFKLAKMGMKPGTCRQTAKQETKLPRPLSPSLLPTSDPRLRVYIGLE